MKKQLTICHAALLLLFTTLGLYAQSGALDPSFDPRNSGSVNNDRGNHGANSSISAIAVQPDGKILIGGSFTTYLGTVRNRIARLNADGSLDTSFDPGEGPNFPVAAIALQRDGKILIGGAFTYYNYSTKCGYITRLNADGSLDSGFNSRRPGSSSFDSEGASYVVNAIAIQSNGKILIGGQFATYNNIKRNGIARLNADGSLDSGFDAGSVGGYGSEAGSFDAIALQPDGKILIGKHFLLANDTEHNYIMRLNADGKLDTGFNPGSELSTTGAPFVDAIAVQPDGKVLIGGNFIYSKQRNGIARLNADGSLDSGFEANSVTSYSSGYSSVGVIALQPDGKILIGGQFKYYNGTKRNGIARLNANGSLDTSFDPSDGIEVYSNGVSAIALQPDGKILIGGWFTSYNRTKRDNIARLNGHLDIGKGANTLFSNGNIIALKSDNGKWLARCHGCQKSTYPNTATAHQAGNISDIPAYAKFYVENASPGKMGLRADNGSYLARCNKCVTGGPDDIIAIGNVTDFNNSLSQFQPEKLPNGKYVFKADNGKYLARCNGCSSGSTTPDIVAIHEPDKNKPWAQWEVKIYDERCQCWK